MAITVKIERIGDDPITKLPEEALAHLKANVGDTSNL
jgi:hypothetical protein